MTATLRSTWESRIGAAVMRRFLNGAGPPVDFRYPDGEPALTPADGISWRVMKNPVALFTGGIAAVILELAEPRIRTGVWNHTTFRSDPVGRMKRTGMAAMVTTYAARSVATRMIAGVNRLHATIAGQTPSGEAYSARDAELLDWVQTTASFGFIEGYAAYVQPLSRAERDSAYAEAVPASRLFGVLSPPTSKADVELRFARMQPRLERSEIVLEFLGIVSRAPILPLPLRSVQRLMIRAGVELVPANVRSLLRIGDAWRLRGWERRVLCLAGASSDRIAIPGSPPVEACRRVGLPTTWLYNSRQAPLRPI